MARDRDEAVRRPERVIILDADDPMTEIHGQFVWQEDHDRAVEAARAEAFAAGFEAGRMEAAGHPVEVVVRRRRPLGGTVMLCVGIVAALCLMLMLPILLG